jgi:hypothetical protein
MGEGHSPAESETPETLGLLAHELTHVARRRAPELVPPVVAVAGPTVVTDGDEEALATLVEARVMGMARSRTNAEMSSTLNTAEANGEPAEATLAPPPPVGAWDDVPAPWEPLPTWLRSEAPSEVAPLGLPWSESPASGAAPRAFGSAAPAVTGPLAAPVSAAAPAPAASGAVGAAVFTAELDRDVGAASEPRTDAAASSPDSGAAVTPDLDSLARQVYGVLKRRLSAEQRRSTWT